MARNHLFMIMRADKIEHYVCPTQPRRGSLPPNVAQQPTTPSLLLTGEQDPETTVLVVIVAQLDDLCIDHWLFVLIISASDGVQQCTTVLGTVYRLGTTHHLIFCGSTFCWLFVFNGEVPFQGTFLVAVFSLALDCPFPPLVLPAVPFLELTPGSLVSFECPEEYILSFGSRLLQLHLSYGAYTW